MLKPMLAQNSAISLIFDEADGVPLLRTDEGKVSQILRNFISNALKFTERGEIRVSAARGAGESVVFSVRDQGIGVSPENLSLIFEEFHQVDGPQQRRHKGTGLGLPLSKKLAELLGGSVRVESEVGAGSTFSVEVPIRYAGPQEVLLFEEISNRPDPSRIPVLVVEDNKEMIFVYEKYLKGTGFQPIPARSLADARRALDTFRPAAILLDVLLEHESSWMLLQKLKSEAATKDIPVIVVTTVDNRNKALSLGADHFAVKPIEREWLLARLKELTPHLPRERALVIDDDEASRYVLKTLLAETRYVVLEASNGPDGLRIAEAERPDIIFIDLVMPGMGGLEVLDRLALASATRDIPTVINTSKSLSVEERERIMTRAVGILSKDRSSHEASVAALKQLLNLARSTGGALRVGGRS
jgi:CheY-like chemotaxis protein